MSTLDGVGAGLGLGLGLLVGVGLAMHHGSPWILVGLLAGLMLGMIVEVTLARYLCAAALRRRAHRGGSGLSPVVATQRSASGERSSHTSDDINRSGIVSTD